MSTRHDVVVPPDGDTPDVELVLVRPGRIAGTVVDETGAGVADATVSVRDAEGRMLYELDATTDYEGSFTLERVPEGDVLVSARTATHVSAAARTTAREGAEATVELALRAGVVLKVVLEDEDGDPVRAAIRVEDETGRDFALRAVYDEVELYTGGVSSSERRVGPLPPGRYTLHARAEDGRSARLETSVRPEPAEQTVLLALTD